MVDLNLNDIDFNSKRYKSIKLNNLEIHVLSQYDAVRFCPDNDYTVIIRINEPNQVNPEKLQYEDKFKDILNLNFEDYTKRDIEVLRNNSELETKRLFTTEDAQRILNFIENNKDAKTIVVHCNAGIRRSPAIAKGIGKYFENDEIIRFIDDNSNFIPNDFVQGIFEKEIKRKLTKNALEKF